MKTETVWRFEDVDGFGIYASGAAREAGMPTGYSTEHPAPDNDPNLTFDGCWHYVFGFSSLDDINLWMYEDIWFWKMEAEGIRIREYRAHKHDVKKGHRQSIFRPEFADKVNEYTPTEFLKNVLGR